MDEATKEREGLRAALKLTEWAPGCTESDDCDPGQFCQVCRAIRKRPEGHFENCPVAKALGSKRGGGMSPSKRCPQQSPDDPR